MIRRKAELVEPLVIAVIGYNAERTVEALRKIRDISEESSDPIVKIYPFRYKMIAKSGTVYEGILSDEVSHILGKTYDQLIVAEDRGWRTLQKRSETITEIVKRLDENIPKNYKVQYMEV